MLDRAAAGQPVSDPNQAAPSPAEPAAETPAQEPAAPETPKDSSTEPKPEAPAAEVPAKEAVEPVAPPTAPAAPAAAAAAGPVDVSAFDKTIRPQNDLYEYDKSNYGAFIKLDDLSRERIRAIVEQAAAAEAPIGSDARKVGDFHRAFMNTERTASLGYEPIAAILGHINGLGSHDDLAHAFGMGGQFGVASPIGHYVGIDDKDSTRHLTTVAQGGTTLPDRDYYLKTPRPSLARRCSPLKSSSPRSSGRASSSATRSRPTTSLPPTTLRPRPRTSAGQSFSRRPARRASPR
jgi:hypothetical protein